MKFNRTTRLFGIVCLMTALALSGGCGKKDADTTVTEDKSVPVTITEVKTGSISTGTSISGKVAPLQEVAIIPKVPGKAVQVPVDVGTRVRKGSLLVKLDTTDLEISLSSALNGLQNAKITNDQAKLNYDNAKTNYDRMKLLYKDGAISFQQLEQAELAYNLARDAIKAPVVATAQTQIDSIRNQIANATITSPIDGEVAIRNIDPGEMAGNAYVMTIVNIDTVFVEGSIAEGDIGLVKQGQEVSVKVDAAGGTFDGIVKIVSPVVDQQTKGYPVKVEIKNPGHKLKPGMFAEIKLVTTDKKDIVVVPKETLLNRGTSKAVYVVENNIALERPVETGIESDDMIEIIKGLNVGEKIVIQGQQSLFDKAKVSVKSGSTGS